MQQEAKNNLMLSGYRALELGENGLLCGQILADLGAEVIKIERPGGDPARNVAPFWHDIPHPERSLFWLAYNTGKKSITLNIETAGGQELFRKLVGTSSFLIESFDRGYMERLGVGYDTLAGINQGLVMAAITPFGQEGPYRDFKGPDPICMALGGATYLIGDPDRPPVPIGFPQAYFFASLMAAVGLMVAHYYRESTGKGQFVDVSAQESVAWMLGNAWISYQFAGVLLKRGGQLRGGLYASAAQRLIWQCQDGAVVFNTGGGQAFAKSNRALVEAMDSEGFADDFLRTVDWEARDMGTIKQEFLDALESRIAAFFMAHTKFQLYEMALKRGFLLTPMSTSQELLENQQLKARGYWQRVEHPELSSAILYPAPFFRTLPYGCQRPDPAPCAGEHNRQVYVDELGLSAEQLVMLKEAGAI